MARERPQPTALARAVGLLSRREHSRRELKRKLDAKGVPADEAEAALERLAGQGLQDDTRFAEMLVRSRIGAGQGPLRIRAELATHGIGSDAIEAAFADNEVDWDLQARDVVERRYRSDELRDPARKRKAIEFLLRRGFELDSARRAVEPA